MRALISLLTITACTSIPDPTEHSDDFPDPPAVDVVLVIDNVPGTDAFQADLGNGLTNLAKVLEAFGADYQIGVLANADASDPAFEAFRQDSSGQHWIDPESGDLLGELRAAALVGETRAPSMVREQVFAAVDGPVNGGFRREEAPLHVIVWSPRDDRSAERPVSREDFITWLNSQQEPSAYHAVVGIPPDCDGAIVGEQHMWVSEYTGGHATSICAPEWGEILSAVVPGSAQ